MSVNWHGRQRKGKCGEVLLEFVLALIGIVLFLYTIVGVWMWLNQAIVDRQVHPDSQKGFQAGRTAAGKHTTPQQERVIHFQPELLKLMGKDLGAMQARAISLKNRSKASCDDAKPFYDKALADIAEVDRLDKKGGPIDLLQQAIQETLERMCLSGGTSPQQVQTRGAKNCDDLNSRDPDCINQVTIDGTTYPSLTALGGSCIGLGSADAMQDKNWTRCAAYWFQRATDEDDNDDRKSLLNNAHYCRCNAYALQQHIERLGSQIEELSAYTDALTARAEWNFRTGDCACVKADQQPEEFKRCQAGVGKEKEPVVTKPTVSEVPPPQPALRGGNRHGCS